MIGIKLNRLDDELLGSQTNPEFLITYHKDSDDATLGNNVLLNTYSTQTPFKTTLYARIENSLNPDCFDISNPIEITINPKPEYTNTTLIQCDEDTLNDETTGINLNEATAILTNNFSDRTVRFFKFLNDAESGTNEILNTERYKNENNPQIIDKKIVIFFEILIFNSECRIFQNNLS